MIYKEDVKKLLSIIGNEDYDTENMLLSILKQLNATDEEHPFHFDDADAPQVYANRNGEIILADVTDIWVGSYYGEPSVRMNYKEVGGEHREFVNVLLVNEPLISATEILEYIGDKLESKPEEETAEFYVVHECICNHSYVACMSKKWDVIENMLRENYGMDDEQINLFRENGEYYMVMRDTKLFLEKVPVDTFVGVSIKTVDKIGRDMRVAEHLSQD